MNFGSRKGVADGNVIAEFHFAAAIEQTAISPNKRMQFIGLKRNEWMFAAIGI